MMKKYRDKYSRKYNDISASKKSLHQARYHLIVVSNIVADTTFSLWSSLIVHNVFKRTHGYGENSWWKQGTMYIVVVHAWLSEVMCIGTSRVLFQLYLQSSICLTIILGVNRLGEGASAFGGNPQIFIWKCDVFFCDPVYNLQQNWVFERLKIDLFFQTSNKIHFITFNTVCNS